MSSGKKMSPLKRSNHLAKSSLQFLDFGKHGGKQVWVLKTVSTSSLCKATDNLLKKKDQLKQEGKLKHDLRMNLKACRDLQWGKIIHAELLESEISLDIHVVNALIIMYRKCESMRDARAVFDSVEDASVDHWTNLMVGYAENGEGLAALDLFTRMKLRGYSPSSVVYIAALKACTSLVLSGQTDYLERGRKIHLEIGDQLEHYVQSTLITMYAKCGSMDEARKVFDSIKKPNTVSWTALLLGYASNGEARVAMDMFERMKAARFSPDPVTYIAVLSACMSLACTGDAKEKLDCLELGRQIHSVIGCHINNRMQTTLVDLYCKCGSMLDARKVFESIKKPDVVSWNTLLFGYVENGGGQVALSLFSTMKNRGFVPDSVTYIAALKACTSLAVNGDGTGQSLKVGRDIHSEIGQHLNDYVKTTLVDMYSTCGSMIEARCVFDSIHGPSVVSWNALLFGYLQNKDAHVSLYLLARMKAAGVEPDSGTYVAGLMACGCTGALTLGRRLHRELTDFTPHVVTCLVDFYAKCGSMTEAREVWEVHSSSRNISAWTALLAGYARFGDSACVFKLFGAMQDEGLRPDAVTFACLLLCCNHAGAVEKAKEYLEAMPVHYGVTPDVMHYNCMVDVLGRANQLKEAIEMVERMPPTPNAVTWMTLLGACRKWKNVEIGKQAYRALLDIGKANASSRVLMADICKDL